MIAVEMKMKIKRVFCFLHCFSRSFWMSPQRLKWQRNCGWTMDFEATAVAESRRWSIYALCTGWDVLNG